jgi:hypothetical protein
MVDTTERDGLCPRRTGGKRKDLCQDMRIATGYTSLDRSLPA